jgi:hypothetical protein
MQHGPRLERLSPVNMSGRISCLGAPAHGTLALFRCSTSVCCNLGVFQFDLTPRESGVQPAPPSHARVVLHNGVCCAPG